MIEYHEVYEFENDIGKWSVDVRTHEHPTDYGNGMLVQFKPKGPQPIYNIPVTYDVRYEPLESESDIDRFAKEVLRERYGAEL